MALSTGAFHERQRGRPGGDRLFGLQTLAAPSAYADERTELWAQVNSDHGVAYSLDLLALKRGLSFSVELINGLPQLPQKTSLILGRKCFEFVPDVIQDGISHDNDHQVPIGLSLRGRPFLHLALGGGDVGPAGRGR